ncbi:MAG: phosphoribosylanthranilate isomerase [Hyphomicrobiaceae bacterium]
MTDAKICGIKTAEALEAAIEAGARWVGFVLFEKSPRNLPLETAAALAGMARGRVRTVVLLVDPDDAKVRDVARVVAPDYLQLHGRESPDRVGEIARLSGLPVIKAVGVATEADVRAAFRYREAPAKANLVLLDAKPPAGAAMPGGHGLTFDWRILSAVPVDMPYMLAGGLTPDNVREAIGRTGAPSVDVSSGVEVAPGDKSAELIRHFLQAVKTANEAL